MLKLGRFLFITKTGELSVHVEKIELLTKANITELPGIEESVIFRLPKI